MRLKMRGGLSNLTKVCEINANREMHVCSFHASDITDSLVFCELAQTEAACEIKICLCVNERETNRYICKFWV